MFNKRILSTAAFCVALSLSSAFAARVTSRAYQPHYMASVEDASNRVQFLSARLIPLRMGSKAVASGVGYTLERLSENKLGLNLFFPKSGVEQKTEYFWAWNGGYDAPIATPFKSDVVTSIFFAEIESFEIWNFPWTKASHEAWCVVPVVAHSESNSTGKHKGKGGGENNVSGLKNNVICATSEADAEGFADALATLTVAGGKALDTASSADVARLQAQVANLARRNAAPPVTVSVPAAIQSAPATAFHLGIRVRAVTDADVAALALPKLIGVVITGVEKGGIAEEMQLQTGDVVVEVNGSEIGDVDFFTQFVRSGAARSFRIWRQGKAVLLTVPQSM